MRQSNLKVAPVFLERWSPRSYEPKAMPKEDLLTMLEAARWAPSAYNIQPWRFVYVMRTDEAWDEYVNLLDEFNQSWAKDASALVFLVSHTMVPESEYGPAAPSTTHDFDAGAAWAHLALQASMMGYHAHAMAGVHHDKVLEKTGLSGEYKSQIAIAIGYKGDKEKLADFLQDKEAPSPRMPLEQMSFDKVVSEL